MKLGTGSVPLPAVTRTRRPGRIVSIVLLSAAGIGSPAAANQPGGPAVAPPASSAPAGARREGPARTAGIYWIYWGPSYEDEARKSATDDGPAFTARAERRLRKAGVDRSVADPTNRPVPRPFLDHLRGLGIEARVASRFLRAVSAALSVEDLRQLQADPGVAALEPVFRRVRSSEGAPAGAARSRAAPPSPARAAADTLPDPRTLSHADYGASWNQCEQLGVTTLHQLGYSGRGVLVCLLDGGFYVGHEAFVRLHVVAARDFVEHDRTVGYDPYRIGDQYNTPQMEYHGTYTFSALGGFAPGALIGPAFHADFALGRTEVVETETRMEEDTYVAGLEWADSLGADVVSTSLGYREFTDYEYWPEELDGRTAVTSRAAAWLVRRGVALVTAMGNEGPGPATLVTPADAESVIAVGAVDGRGLVADFSSRGPNALGVTKPDVCARGVAAACATASAYDAYSSVNGTSLATPLIGGLAALLLEAHPEWTPAQLQQSLHRAGSRSHAPDNLRGWGVPDGAAALGAIDPADTVSSQLTVRSVSWVDEGEPGAAVPPDSLASPGQRGRLRLVLVNAGDLPTRAAQVSLAAVPPGLAADGDSVRVEELGPGEQVTLAAGPTLAVAVDHPVPQVDRLALSFRTDLGVTYLRTVSLSVVAPPRRVRPYPNPLVAPYELTLELGGPADGPVTFSVFDVSGRRVAHPTIHPASAGYRVRWTPDASLPAGVYYLRFDAGARVREQRVVLIRTGP